MLWVAALVLFGLWVGGFAQSPWLGALLPLLLFAVLLALLVRILRKGQSSPS